MSNNSTTREEQDARVNACCNELLELMRAMFEDGRADGETLLHALAVTVGAYLNNGFGSSAHEAAKVFADEVAQTIDLEAMEKQTGGRLQ